MARQARGLALAARTEITAPLSPDDRLGAQLFSGFNRPNSVGAFKDQSYRLGTVFKVKASHNRFTKQMRAGSFPWPCPWPVHR